MATLTKRKTDKSGSTSFAVAGLKSSVYFNKGMFANDKIPDSVDITLPDGFSFSEPGSVKTGIAKLTPEERKANAVALAAKRAAMSPAEKAAARLEAAKAALAAAEKAAAKAAAATV